MEVQKSTTSIPELLCSGCFMWKCFRLLKKSVEESPQHVYFRFIRIRQIFTYFRIFPYQKFSLFWFFYFSVFERLLGVFNRGSEDTLCWVLYRLWVESWHLLLFCLFFTDLRLAGFPMRPGGNLRRLFNPHRMFPSQTHHVTCDKTPSSISTRCLPEHFTIWHEEQLRGTSARFTR